MIPTPDLSHIKKTDYEDVYEPSEDTFIMMDALEADLPAIKRVDIPIVLEIGSGSGCVSSFIASALGSKGAFFCTDINSKAALLSYKTGEQNKRLINATQMDFAGSFLHRLGGKVDVLIFNPPYVVTPHEELNDSSLLSKSWAGGIDGREILDRLMESGQPSRLLSPTGAFYVILIKANKPAEFLKSAGRFGLIGEILLQRKTFLEHLFVIKLTRRS